MSFEFSTPGGPKIDVPKAEEIPAKISAPETVTPPGPIEEKMLTPEGEIPKGPILAENLPSEDELTPDKLKNLHTLETTVDANFNPILESINSELGLNLTPRPEGYHVTIIGPTESKILSSLTPEQIQQLQEINRSIQMGEGIWVSGIGFIDGSQQEGIRDADKNKKTCFLSLDAPALQEFRKSVGLPKKDLHVTLGFDGGDIHMEIKGKNEKGKDILGPVAKKSNPAFDKYLQTLPEIKFTTLSGQEKQKPKV